MEKRDTVGKISSELLVKEATVLADHSSEEQMRKMLEDWDKNVTEALEDGRKVFDYNADFYLVVVTKKEPKMQNVLRNYFFTRVSCPTPTYDQTVFRYTFKDDRLEFLWVLPSKQTCQMIKERALELMKDQRQLVQFVLDDADETLLRKAKQLNGEL